MTIYLLAAAFLVAQELPPGTVVGKVEGKDITVADVQKMADAAPPQAKDLFRNNPKFAVEQMMMMRYLAEEAARQKIDQQTPWKEQLEFTRTNLMAGALVTMQRNGFSVTSEEITQLYTANKQRYEKVKIQVIYIGFTSKEGPEVKGTSPEAVKDAARLALEQAHAKEQRTEAQAKEKAEGIVKQLRAGADFEKMVAEHSEDVTSKANKGDFGVLRHGDAYPEDLKKAVFALQPGEIGNPVRQPNAYYIIRVVEKTLQPMSDVTEALVGEIRQKKFQAWFDGLQKRFQLQVEKPEFFKTPGK